MHKRFGFTIVEVMVVIIVIGILASITTVAYSRQQASARDAERDTKVRIVMNELEKYYEQNGEYPACTSLRGNGNTPQQVTNVLRSLEPDTLAFPSGSTANGNDLRCTLGDAALRESDVFSMTSSNNLRYWSESEGRIVTIHSRR